MVGSWSLLIFGCTFNTDYYFKKLNSIMSDFDGKPPGNTMAAHWKNIEGNNVDSILFTRKLHRHAHEIIRN